MTDLIPIASMVLARYPIRAFKVGGLRFLRIGRLQFSFCLCRRRRL